LPPDYFFSVIALIKSILNYFDDYPLYECEYEENVKNRGLDGKFFAKTYILL